MLLDIIIFLAGLFIYFRKPRYFFLFYITVQPLLLPFYFKLFPEGNGEVFNGIYFSYKTPLSYLVLLFLILNILKGEFDYRKVKKVLIPATILVGFFILQNIGFAILG